MGGCLSTGKQETKTKGMCIATRCTSVDQFVQMFHRFVEDQSFFVSTLNTRPPGLETSFSVQLADGTPVLRGLCIVQQAWTTAANPFKTPGVRLGIKRLTAQSTPVFERLLATRNATRKPPVTPQLASVVVAKPGTPKPIERSPYTETAPAVSGGSRLELRQPARPSSEPTTIEPQRATTGDAVPRPVAAEITDMMEEKTDVRVPSIPIAQLAAGSVVGAKPGAPPKPLDVKEVAKPLAPAEPVRDDARTPGSDLVLPANPLMNLSDESLEGYVDCTLYEETGTFFPADDDTSFADDVAPPPSAEPVAAAAPADGNPRAAAAPARFDTASSLVTPPPMPPPPAVPRDGAGVDASSIARGSAPVLPGDGPRQTASDAPSIVIESGDAAPKLPLAPPDAESAPLSVAASDVLVPTPRKRLPWLVFGGGARPPWLLLGGGAGVLAVTTLVIVMTTSSNGGARAPAAPAPTKTAANEVVPAVKVEPPTAKPPVAEDADAAEDGDEPSSDDAPTVGSGPCKVVVRSTPAGSIVKLDGNSVGPSPITVAASCGKHKVDVVHPRYALGTKLVSLEAGKAETLELTLSRPTHVVTVTSSPSGAQIFLNGRSAGTTPTKLNVLGFVTLKLELKKTGYQPASAKLYSKKAQDNVALRLSKW